MSIYINTWTRTHPSPFCRHELQPLTVEPLLHPPESATLCAAQGIVVYLVAVSLQSLIFSFRYSMYSLAAAGVLVCGEAGANDITNYGDP